MSGNLIFSTGHADEGEGLLEGAAREAWEETGCANTALVGGVALYSASLWQLSQPIYAGHSLFARNPAAGETAAGSGAFYSGGT